MGRYYKTAAATPIDYMHRDNIPLMQQALITNDQYITGNLNKLQELTGLADSFNHLAVHNDQATKIAEDYNTKINQVTDAIRADPANWRKSVPQLRTLSQDLATNYKSGDISKMMKNYTDYKTWKDASNKMVEEYTKTGGKKGGYSSKTQLAYENKAMADWAKNNYAYDKMTLPTIDPDRDIKTELSEGVDKLKASGVIRKSPTQSGMYEIYQNNEWKGVTPDRVLAAVTSNLTPELAQYMKSRQDVGLLSNIFDDKGELIQPFGTDANGNLMWNSNSALAPIMKGIVGANSWMQTKSETEVKPNQVALQQWLQSRRETQQNADRNQRLNIFNQGEQNKKDAANLKWDRAKELLQLKAANGDKKAGKQIDNMNAVQYIGSIPSPAHSFETDISLINAGRGTDSLPNDGQTYVTATPDTKAFTPNGRVEAAKNAAKIATTNQYNNDDARNYIDFLNGRKSSEELAKEFLERKKGVFQKTGQSLFGNMSNNARWTPNWMKSDEAKQWDNIYQIGESYNKNLENWYADSNNDVANVSVNTFVPQYQTAVAQVINTSPQQYFTIDKDGNPTQTFGKVKTVLGGTGGNSQSNMAYHVEMDNGEKKWIFPNPTNPNVYKLNKYLALEGLKDKNTPYAVEMRNDLVNDIKTTLMQGTRSDKGINNIITIGNEQIPAVLKDDGTIVITDKDGNNPKTYSSIARFVELSTR